MRQYFQASLIIGLFALSSCDSNEGQGAAVGESIQFTSLYKTPARDVSGTTLEGQSKTFRVFYSQSEFNSFIQRYPFFLDVLSQEGMVPSQQEFEAGALIMAYLGEMSSTGYDIRISNVNLLREGYAIVSIDSEVAAAGCPVGDAITYPMHLVYVPQKIDFVFEEEISAYGC